MSIPPTKPAATREGTELAWRVHLLRQNPERLPGLLLVLFIGTACVRLIFFQLLPVLAALLLLLGAASDYLFPVSYRITEEGVHASGLTSRYVLKWSEARRCLWSRDAVIVTPLPKPSRLDAFRGVLLRFAPDGEPGDRASVLEALFRQAPDLLPDSSGHSQPAERKATA